MQRPLLVGLAVICSAMPAPCSAAQAPAGLRQLPVVRIVENDSLFLTRPIEIALGPGGMVFVTEASEARVLGITPNGRIEKSFGRQGRGPGEFVSPATLAAAGDSMLLVFDRGQRRITSIRLPSWTLGAIIPLPEAWPPTMRVVNGAVLVRSYDWDQKTSLAQLDAAGTLVNREGVIPDVGLKYPMLIHGAFPGAIFAIAGTTAYAMFEVSPALYQWPRGGRVATTLTLPAPRRRGVRTELFEQLLQDPGNAARNQELLQNRSVPVALETMTSSMLVLVTKDVAVANDSQTVVHHVTVVDLQRRRACPDLAIPSSRGRVSMRDPHPPVAVRGDTLVILDDVPDSRGEPGPALRRFRIEPARCEQWLGLAP